VCVLFVYRHTVRAVRAVHTIVHPSFYSGTAVHMDCQYLRVRAHLQQQVAVHLCTLFRPVVAFLLRLYRCYTAESLPVSCPVRFDWTQGCSVASSHQFEPAEVCFGWIFMFLGGHVLSRTLFRCCCSFTCQSQCNVQLVSQSFHS
jgi:hypothetical protein